jgi:hypothetical protein
MLIARLRNHISDHNWFAVLVDIAVVVGSILAAFQIDRWAEINRVQELEQEYLLRLKEDLQMEVDKMESALVYANDRLEAIKLLEQITHQPAGEFDSPSVLPWALETATWRSFPQITGFVYQELQNTGNLTLVRSESIRRGLAEHYQVLQHESRVGLDLEAQHQFEKLTAGILTIDELIAVESASWGDQTTKISAERGMEIIKALKLRNEAIAFLPSLAQHHTFNIKVISAAVQRAQHLIEQIEILISADFRT